MTRPDRLRGLVGACPILVSTALLAEGPLPLGEEFQVNLETVGYQTGPAVAADPAGNFVVIWSGEVGGYSRRDVFGRRFDASGNALGADFQVNTYTTDFQWAGDVIATASGEFVVVWTGQDGFLYGVSGQRYDSAGNPLGREFLINTYTAWSQDSPSAAVDAAGNFVVAFRTDREFAVAAQRYDAAGLPLGAEFRVNTYESSARYPAVAADTAGNFVVVWTSAHDGGSEGIFGQRYDAEGRPVGEEFQVNTYTTEIQWIPDVAMDAAGNFVVVWESRDQDGSESGVFGQRYDATGGRVGPEFQVNAYTTGDQGGQRVSVEPGGDFVVVWQDGEQEAKGYGIFGRRYDASGRPIGGDFQVNTYTTSIQLSSDVAVDEAGNSAAVWMSWDQDGSGWGIFGQRFGAEELVFLDGFESGDTSAWSEALF